MEYDCIDCKNHYNVNNHRGCAVHCTNFKPSECDRFERDWSKIIGFYIFLIVFFGALIGSPIMIILKLSGII